MGEKTYIARQDTLETVQSKATEILEGLGFSGGGIESTVVEMLQELLKDKNKVLRKYEATTSVLKGEAERDFINIAGKGQFFGINLERYAGCRIIIDGIEVYNLPAEKAYDYVSIRPGSLTMWAKSVSNVGIPYIEFKNTLVIKVSGYAQYNAGIITCSYGLYEEA